MEEIAKALNDSQRALVVKRVRAAVEALVARHGANLRDKDGNTFLHALATAMDGEFRERSVPAVVEAARILLDAGADAGARNAEGCTPLDKAVFVANQPELVELLLERGGAPTTKQDRKRFYDTYRDMYEDMFDYDIDVCVCDGMSTTDYVPCISPVFKERQERIFEALRRHGGAMFANASVSYMMS